ncbi:MAG: hypothetical protein JRN15_14080, partial [Nitrososphaerota archaeon]|nr:hypothetical protein [Nitrososphaerota archaeon]
HNLPLGHIAEFIIPPILCRFSSYDQIGDIVHDTRGDSVFRGVNVSTIHDLYWNYPQTKLSSRLVRFASLLLQSYHRALKLSKAVIVPSEFTRKEILKFYGTRYEGKLRVIPKPCENVAPNLSSNTTPEYDVLWIGSTLTRKRLSMFLESVFRLPLSYSIYLKLTYTHPLISEDRVEIKRLVDILRRQGRSITISDNYIENIYDIYHHARCIVSTSQYEGFHNPIAEAYVNGTNIVIPRDSIYSSLYPLGEGIHWYQHTIELPSVIVSAVENGKFKPNERVVEYLSPKNVGISLRQTYEEVIGY